MINAKTSLNRAALKGSAASFAIVMFAASGAAFAQTAATTTAAAANAADDDTIVVTGSLIKNPNLVSAAPITVTTADTIQLRGVNTAEQVLRDIPGIVPSIGSAVNNGNGGASYVDLRGIGSRRNIVLLDGNRITPADFEGRVDLNNIPLALVERVDALTGAAVTTYGADAISGVVNFITKQDFSGVDLQVSDTLTERGDGNFFRTDLTVGGNFDDGRGNAVLSIGYQKADAVYQGARDFSVTGLASSDGSPGGSGTSVPSRFSGTRPQTGGVINTIAPFTQTGVNAAGLPILDAVTGGAANGGLRQIDPVTGFTSPTTKFFNFNPYNIFQTPFERFNIYAQAKYALSDSVEAYARGMFSKNKVGTIIAPSGSFGSTITTPLNNPFLPAGLRSQFCAFNVSPNVSGVTPAGVATLGQTAYVPRFAPDQCARAAQGLSATENVLNATTGVISQVNRDTPSVTGTVNRRTTELGPRTSDFTTQVFDYRAGLRGQITEGIDWDVNASYGESTNSSVIGGYVLTSRLQQAANATNTTTCTLNTGGCVPINLFGPEGSITPAMATFINARSFTQINTSLAQLRGVVSGDLGFAVPGATDAIGFAIGSEYRKYKAEQLADTIASTAGQLGGGGAATLPFRGGYDVKEVYGELIAPLIQDKPFFQNLTLEAGARYSAYNVDAATGDRSYDAFTWKAGGTWEMVDGFKIRGNYSRAVRAPNLAELFQPPVVTLVNLNADPCSGAAPVSNLLLRAVCLGQGAPSGSIGSITNPTAGQAQSTQGGNLGLVPEKADTWTVGAVFQPSFVPGLALTADYYDIRVNDAITTPVSGDIIAACFGTLTAASATSAACTSTRRNPVTGGLDGTADSTPGLFAPLTNAGRIATRGLDLTATYSNDIGFATLGLQGNANWTFSQTFQASPTAISRQCVGFFSPDCGFTGSLQPKFQSSLRATLGFDAFDISGVWRHLSGLIQEPLNASTNGAFFTPFRTIPAYNYFDLAGRVSVNEQITIIATVTNLLDKDPPIVGADAGSTSFNSGNTFPSTYDPLGRRYTMQVQVKF